MANGTDPIACLLAVASAAASGRPLEGEAASWFAAGVRTYLREGEPLERCLGLAGTGWSAPTRFAYRERNKALRRAAALVHMDMGRLADAVVRFDGTTWPRWRHMDAPPARADDLRRALFDAFSAGAPVPTSPRQLRRITVENDSSAPFD
jgi:hypothetical protein